MISDVADGIADGHGLLLRDLGQVPLSRLNDGTPRGAAPEQNPVQPTQELRFQCEIPRTAIGSCDDEGTWVRPAVPTLYGHGLLGGKGEVGGSSTERLRELNRMALHHRLDRHGHARCALDLADPAGDGPVRLPQRPRAAGHHQLAFHGPAAQAPGRAGQRSRLPERRRPARSLERARGLRRQQPGRDSRRAGHRHVHGWNTRLAGRSGHEPRHPLRRSVDFDPYGTLLLRGLSQQLRSVLHPLPGEQSPGARREHRLHQCAAARISLQPISIRSC